MAGARRAQKQLQRALDEATYWFSVVIEINPEARARTVERYEASIGRAAHAVRQAGVDPRPMLEARRAESAQEMLATWHALLDRVIVSLGLPG